MTHGIKHRHDQAERRLFVMNVAVAAAITTIFTAPRPGQLGRRSDERDNDEPNESRAHPDSPAQVRNVHQTAPSAKRNDCVHNQIDTRNG